MRNTARTRLLSLLLSGMLALAPMPLMAAVYKCERNGQVVYSDAPCGKSQQEVQTQVVVVPSSHPEAAPAKPSPAAKGVLSALGLDTRSGIIAALLFGIPLSIMLVFFLTRKSQD